MESALLIQTARDTGADTAAVIPLSALSVHPEFRDLCAQNKCGRYGTCWRCPPALGALSDCVNTLRQYEYGLVLSRVFPLEDAFDWDGMMTAKTSFDRLLLDIYDALRTKGCADVLPLGAGGCTLCDTCAYPAPCRAPERAFASLEGYGLNVAEVMRAAGLSYRFGGETVQYCAMIAF